MNGSMSASFSALVSRFLCRAGTLPVLLALMASHGSELSPAEEAAARKLYTLKCAKCHEFYEPSAYSEPEWRKWMSKMRKKSHLSVSDYDLLLKYTLELRSGELRTGRQP